MKPTHDPHRKSPQEKPKQHRHILPTEIYIMFYADSAFAVPHIRANH
jgi:hypothetical protein